MLKVRIVAIGKDKDAWITEGSRHYTKLLSRYATVETEIIPSLKSSSSLSPAEVKDREADRFEKAKLRGFVIALSDRGIKMDTIKLSREIERLQNRTGAITFLIGGAHGLNERIIERADMVLSLSPLTFSHQLVRLVLLEQLYRVFSLLHGGSYHK